ncbi:MAG: type I polyketide synthase [Anaerolineales bacterium]|nr:type I polyketide synthase [Anaerolineales bacterium]
MNRAGPTARLTAKQQAVLALRLQEQRPPGPSINEPIAVIGMGCRFPGGADSPEAFWELLKNGVDAVDEVPPARWPVDAYYDPDPAAAGKMYSRWGAFLSEVDAFDARFFGLARREVDNMDPQQRLLLEVTWEALENAGIVPAELERTPTGVFVGISTADYARIGLGNGDLGRIDAYYGTGNSFSVAAGRIAFLLGAQGPVFALDTACSSSLVALHEAVRSLRARDCSLALVGGVNLMLIPDTTVFFAKLQSLSPDGRCKAFDASANGYVRGEGAGAVVLKRLSAAIRDGDPLRAIIRGTAINHDGPSSGLTVPNGPAQQAVIRLALRDGNVDPAQIGYVEAHGTGTALGDPIEMHALAAVFGAAASGQHFEPSPPLYVGSVKSNLGHLEAAAGIAGLLKVVLALQHQQIPPHLHFREPSPRIEWAKLGAVQVPTRLTPWPARPGSARMAGLSSFGFSGTNAHVVLEEAPLPAPSTRPAAQDVLLPLSAKSAEALRRLAGRWAEFLLAHPELRADDVAFTAARRRAHYDHRLAAVAASTGALAEKLAAFAGGESPDGLAAGIVGPRRSGEVVFVFPGQGPEWAGMGQQLYAESAVFRETIEACHAIVQDVAGWSLRAYFEQGPDAPSLVGVAIIHPVLFALQVGLARLWQSRGIRPAAVVGQSLGEITALHIAGSLGLRDALTLMVARSQLISQLHGTGRMVMAGLSEPEARAAIAEMGEQLYVAVQRGPDSVVVAGRPEPVDRFAARMQAAGVFCRIVVGDVATHCPVADPVVDRLGEWAAGLLAAPSEVAFYSSVTASRFAPERVNAAYWQRNITEPVRWYGALQALLTDGYQIFLEVSPHPTLLPTIEQAAQAFDREVVAAGSLVRRQGELVSLLANAGKLYTSGIAPDWQALVPTGTVLPLPTYAWDRDRYWVKADNGRGPAHVMRQPAGSSGPVALRGQRVASPLAALQFSAAFDVATPPYLPDHRVEGAIVVAGASHVAQVLEVASTAFAAQPVTLRSLSFVEPMLLPGDEALAVQTVLDPAGAGRYTVRLFSRPEQAAMADKWSLHVTALLEAGQDQERAPQPISDWLAASDPLSLGDYHAALDAQPYRLTGSFRRLEALWRQADGSLAGRFRAPMSPDEADDYRLHPGLIDSGLQAIGAAAFFDLDRRPLAPGEIFVPVAIDSVYWHARGEEARWCRARVRPDAGGETIAGDVEFFDEAGRMVAAIAGFQARRIDAGRFTSAGSRRLSHWLYELHWQPQALNLPALPTHGQWLLLRDSQGVAGAVAAELRRRGGFPILVDGADVDDRPEAYRRLLKEALAAHRDLRGVLHFWSLDAQLGQGGPAVEAAVERGCLSVLYLAQALSELPKPPRLWLITQGAIVEASAQPSGPPDQANPRRSAPSRQSAEGVWQSPVWGLGRVIMNELADLRCVLVDVGGAGEAKALVDQVLSGSAENQVVLSGGQRCVARLRPLLSGWAAGMLERDPPVAPLVWSEASYLITGGFGGLGLAAARWLAGNGARHLLLVGRRAPSPQGKLTLDQLRASGVQVIEALADVAQRADLEKALAHLEQLPPLAGVIHSAGTLDDSLLANMDAARLRRVLRAKVLGGWHLHELTQARSLDFFVLFSSVAAVFGSPGQGNHAAASAFLDGLAHYRRSLGLPGLSVNWGPWAGIGAAQGKPSTERVIAGGMAAIEPDWGFELLERLLAAPLPQAIAMAVDWGRWFRAYPAAIGVPLLADLAQAHTGANAVAVAPASAAAQLAGLSRASERRDFLQAFLTREIAGVLRLSPAEIEPDTPFGSLGFDSLMAMELKNKLEKQLGLVLPVSLVWNYPTVAELTGYLAAEFGASLEQAAPRASAPALDPLAELSETELLNKLGDKLERLKKAL